LNDIFADIERVAAALDVANRGREVTQELRARMEAIAKTARSAQIRPRVAIIEWLDPLMAAGNWMPELAALAGGENLFGRAGEHSPRMSFEELAASNPEIVLISPCGFNMDRSFRELPLLGRFPEWLRLPAVKSNQVFVADGHQYFNRPGPRIVESLEILAEIVHPELFNFAHEGSGWRRA
jgi:iron complex transport system substrate-binding protein